MKYPAIATTIGEVTYVEPVGVSLTWTKSAPRDLRGEMFGWLTVVSFAGRVIKSGRPVLRWNCQCRCGKYKQVFGFDLRAGHATTCGCHGNRVGEVPPNRLPLGESSFNTLYSGYRRVARRRRIKFELTIEQFNRLTSQDCHYCGVPPSTVARGRRGHTHGSYTYNGIDRIDNERGYSLDNCRPCCRTCNVAKFTQSESEFRLWVQKVYQHFGSKS